MEAHSNSSPCAGCKFLRRKCQPDCIYAPYFPPDQIRKFQVVHRIFGASNVSKMLQEVHPNCRMDAVSSLAYEAERRLHDPVNGSLGVISDLQHQLNQLQAELSSAKAQLFKCQSLGHTNQSLLAAATINAGPTSSHHYHHHHQPYPSLQHGNMDVSFMGTGNNNIGYDRCYQQNHHFVGRDTKPWVIRTYGGGGTSNNVTESLVSGNDTSNCGQMNKFQYHSAPGGSGGY